MSYTVEYNRVVYKKDNETMLLFIKQGDSNSYGLNNLRSRTWNLIAAGTEKDLWIKIGRRSGSTESGGLQRAKGWNDASWWNIEDYIKLYRSKIANARRMESLFDDFDLKFVIEKSDDVDDLSLQTKIQESIEDLNIPLVGTNYYNKSKKVYQHQVNGYQELLYFLERFPVNYYSDDVHLFFRVECKKNRI